MIDFPSGIIATRDTPSSPIHVSFDTSFTSAFEGICLLSNLVGGSFFWPMLGGAVEDTVSRSQSTSLFFVYTPTFSLNACAVGDMGRWVLGGEV